MSVYKEKDVSLKMDLILQKYNKETGENLSQVKFCKKYNITPATYCNWRSRKAPKVWGALEDALKKANMTFEEAIQIHNK